MINDDFNDNDENEKSITSICQQKSHKNCGIRSAYKTAGGDLCWRRWGA